MEMKSIVEQQARFMRDSVASLEVDRGIGTVSIKWNGGPDENIFLQGEAAETFIEGADALYEEENLDLTREDAYHVMAYQFVS